MSNILIQRPEKSAFSFVKESDGEVIFITFDKLATKKVKLLVGIREGLKEVIKIREEKAKSNNMADLINDE